MAQILNAIQAIAAYIGLGAGLYLVINDDVVGWAWIAVAAVLLIEAVIYRLKD